jgi:hypothetical protein
MHTNTAGKVTGRNRSAATVYGLRANRHRVDMLSLELIMMQVCASQLLSGEW